MAAPAVPLASFSISTSSPSRPLFSISSSPSPPRPSLLRRRSSPRRSPPLRVAAPSSPVADAQESIQIEDFSLESSSSEVFSWRDHWYPVSLIEDLDPKRPTPFQLLNRDIVLWKDPNSGEWVAVDDRCPHRLAPLSVIHLQIEIFEIVEQFIDFIVVLAQEGRIDEDGCLQCSYHGWSFDRTGACTRIPQAAQEGPEANAARSKRACVARFPTLVSQGLLFVWPDENGWEKAAACKPPM